jgi:hypothetical protein
LIGRIRQPLFMCITGFASWATTNTGATIVRQK